MTPLEQTHDAASADHQIGGRSLTTRPTHRRGPVNVYVTARGTRLQGKKSQLESRYSYRSRILETESST